MNKNQISRYIWLVDLLNRHESLSRAEISDYWVKSEFGDGNPMPERTFFNYRRAVEDIFHIDILVDKRGRYYIDRDITDSHKSLTNWLLDSYAVNEAFKMNENASDWVEVEDVPSARGYLPQVLEAIRDLRKISFSYQGFNRSRVEQDIVYRPYFLKRYKQRWYMLGLREKSGELRTYALDRILSLKLLSDEFKRPADLCISEVFGNVLGITTSKAEVRTVRLKATPIQAKYFRALPLHQSQTEEVADGYSIFTYKLKLNYELVHELLGLGSAVTVLEPKELRVMVTVELQEALANYIPGGK